MIRLNRIAIPDCLKRRRAEILGDTKGDTMVDCVYNSILAGDYDDYEPTKVDAKKYVPSFVKDYQIEDLSKSFGLSKVFNINKPGYGKTLETILWIKVTLQKDFRALILCPKSVIDTWVQQLNKYWPGWEKDGMWWITNYEQLYNEERFRVCKEFKWSVIVLDESHTIKSMKSKITKIVFQLNAEHKHCLTGTPIKNRPEDLAAQLKWLDEYSISTYTDFQNAFCDMRFNGFGYAPQGLTRNKVMVENLQKLLDMYCVGGAEHNIGSIDKPDYIKIRLKMDDKVKKLYKQVEGEWSTELEQKVINTKALMDQGIKVSNPIEAVIRRQQLASNPGLFDPQLKNVKFEWIADWLEGTDEKVVIFSKYAQTIKALDTYLRNKKFKVSVIQKEQSPTTRSLVAKQWKASTQVLLGTFGVLGTGVDGLQEACRYIIFVDREWTASDNEQAEKRIWRIGQTRQPIIYILQCIGSIDVRIEKVQLDKGHDARELLDPVIEEEE